MTPSVEIGLADEGAIAFIARNMRPADAREIYATRLVEDPDILARDCVRWSFTSWQASRDGMPVACGGAGEISPGVAKVWMFATGDWPSVMTDVARFMRRSFIPGLEARGIHRAECLSIEGHDEAHRWLVWLGARREASLPLRGRNGQTFHLYAWCVPAVLDRCRRAGDITRSTGSGHRLPTHSSDRKD
jgi:hypothetical protein